MAGRLGWGEGRLEGPESHSGVPLPDCWPASAGPGWGSVPPTPASLPQENQRGQRSGGQRSRGAVLEEGTPASRCACLPTEAGAQASPARAPAGAGPPYLGAVLDVVSLVEAQVAQVVGRGPLAGLAGLRGEGQVGEAPGERAEAVGDVAEGAVG